MRYLSTISCQVNKPTANIIAEAVSKKDWLINQRKRMKKINGIELPGCLWLCPMVSSSRSEIRTDILIMFAWASCLPKPYDLHQGLRHPSKHLAFISTSDRWASKTYPISYSVTTQIYLLTDTKS